MASFTFNDGSPAASGNVLDAMNEIADLVGELQFAALDTDGPSDAGICERILDREGKLVQERGWYYNTRVDVELTASDIGGGVFKIAVPANAILIMPSGGDAYRRLTERNGFIYDLENNTDDFGSAVTIKFRIIEFLTFATLPEYARDHIVGKAAFEYWEDNLRHKRQDPQRRSYLFDQLKQRETRARKLDQAQARTNILETTDARYIRGNRSRHSRRF